MAYSRVYASYSNIVNTCVSDLFSNLSISSERELALDPTVRRHKQTNYAPWCAEMPQGAMHFASVQRENLRKHCTTNTRIPGDGRYKEAACESPATS